MKHVTTMSRNYMTRAISITLILGLLLSSLTFSSSFSEIFSTDVQAVGDYWTDDGSYSIDWYTDYKDTRGTKENPYLIGTAEELAGLAYLVNTGIDGVPVDFEGKTIQLTDDIYLDGHLWVPIGLGKIENNEKEDFDKKDSFKGTFDGNRNEIINIVIDLSYSTDPKYEYSGLFGYIEGATLTNNIITDMREDITSFRHSGGICGYAKNSTINNCANFYTSVSDYSGANWDDRTVGGICGYAEKSTINKCRVDDTIIEVDDSNASAGGICGYIDETTISNCRSYAELYCRNTTLALEDNVYHFGGICGQAKNATINDCTFYEGGRVLPTSAGVMFAGGICGLTNKTKISNCKNLGYVATSSYSKCHSYIGGICGMMGSSTEIRDCTNSGSLAFSCHFSQYGFRVLAGGVNGSRVLAGGVTGCVAGSSDDKSVIENCTNDGSFELTNEYKNSGLTSYLGGICNLENKEINVTLRNNSYENSTATEEIGIIGIDNKVE